MIGNAPLSESTGVPGWETIAEERELIALARQYVPDQDGVIVELGVEYGRSTAQFAHAVKNKQGTRIVSVDLFPDNHHIAGQHGGLMAVWRRNLEEAGVNNLPVYLVPARGVSWEVGDNWSEPIDLLFIDAGHSFDEVSRDISSWLHHVKPGGIVVFHDYAKNDNAHVLHHEVKRAVDGYFWNPANKKGYWIPIDLPDSLIAFERNKNYREEAETVSDKQTTPPETKKPTAKKKTGRKPKG